MSLDFVGNYRLISLLCERIYLNSSDWLQTSQVATDAAQADTTNR